MKQLAAVLSLVAFVASCGRPSSSESTVSASTSSTTSSMIQIVVVHSFQATPTNAGINPQYRATDIAVTFAAGSNACMASMHDFSIKQVVDAKDNAVHIVVESRRAALAPRACTMQYMPVSKTLHTTVFSTVQSPKKIIVDNVRALGNNVIVKI